MASASPGFVVVFALNSVHLGKGHLFDEPQFPHLLHGARKSTTLSRVKNPNLRKSLQVKLG